MCIGRREARDLETIPWHRVCGDIVLSGSGGEPTTRAVSVGRDGREPFGGEFAALLLTSYNVGKPVEYPQTAGTGDGLSRCGRIQHRTRTRDTRDRNTAGKPVPMKYPRTSPTLIQSTCHSWLSQEDTSLLGWCLVDHINLGVSVAPFP
jgi:hypothetical protein